MGKTYIDTVKYLVYANVEIDGLVEKPDVVGAIFGQTEGLLGDELDLRDLQKNGRIGRIEVDLQPRGGRSSGKIKLPSSLDMVETCILAAALETVDRVGPCEARISVEKIEDTRNAKRKVLVDRAKSLLKSLLTNEIPESKEISEMVRQEVKIAEIEEYGPERLPCGPAIEKQDSIIIVEGRADVLNLLKNDITNVVAVGGANITSTIAKLAREKEVTVFLDGDRGGDIILNELARVADIDFVARAPDGKEVEELSRKELIKCLRAKVPFEQAGKEEKQENDRKAAKRYESQERQRRRYEEQKPYSSPASPPAAPSSLQEEVQVPIPPAEAREEAPAPSLQVSEVPPQLLASLEELENTLRARFYNSQLEVIKEMPVRDMIKSLEEQEEVYAIVFDGIITQRLADLSENKKVACLVGIKLGNVFRKPQTVLIYTKT
ncbi:MAG: DNA primase DnaG [Candidatus Micrarchaeota archaeon]|nr:DNA primase DnaG [Candidatus Micrarchaeota archaeon]